MRARRLLTLLLTVVLALTFTVGASARRKKKKKRRGPPPQRKVLEKAEGPATLVIESVDIGPSWAKAVVIVGGWTREPPARVFTFHDDKDRHFIALGSRCEPAPPAMRCTLELPRPYLKARVLGATVHLRGREVEADPAAVEAVFTEAQRKAASEVQPAPAPAMPPGDGGVAPQGGGADGGITLGASFQDWHFGVPPDAGWTQEDEAEDNDSDTEEWRYLKGQEQE